jgi:hypothetical protein
MLIKAIYLSKQLRELKIGNEARQNKVIYTKTEFDLGNLLFLTN